MTTPAPPAFRSANLQRLLAATLCMALCVFVAAAPSARAVAPSHSANGTTAVEGLPEAPAVGARSWAVYDGVDGTLLAGKDPDEPQPIASLTKLMTALLVTRQTTGDEKVTIRKAATRVGDGAALGMKSGQKYPVDALLRAMLVYSANDAAVALAEYVGTDVDKFIEMMNDEADELDLRNTTFTSVNGLDDEGVAATESSPADLVTLSQLALKDPRIREAVRTERVTIQRPGGLAPVVLANRNLLVGKYAGVDGMKTGHTDLAGYCLLTHYDDQDGRELWVVILGERDDDRRFSDTRALLDWAVPLRQPVTTAEAGESVGEVPVAGSSKPEELFVSDDITASLRVGERVRERIVVPVPVEPPLREGDEVGKLELVVDGEVVGSSRLYVSRNLPKTNTWDRVRETASDWRGVVDAGWQEVERGGRSLRRSIDV